MSRFKVASAADVKEKEVLVARTNAGSVALTRLGSDIVAFQNVCTHDDGPLDGAEVEGEEVICPRHGARFNVRSGRVCRMPATSDLEVYRVEISNGDVYVELD